MEILVTKDYHYYINQDYELVNEKSDFYNYILLTEAYKQAKFNQDIMYFESRTARGLNNLNGLIHAIQNQQLVKIEYMSFYNNESEYREIVVEPYALKEFKYRWYLLANDRNNQEFHIHAYGLDRMKNLDIKNSTFKKQEYSVSGAYQHAFGIESPENRKPEKIRLKFDPQQGKYIKSLPIHQSQKVIEEAADFLIIELNLIPSYAFYQEIFSMMDRVEVLSPASVKVEVKRIYERCLGVYSAEA
ncbi:WYL domain-containing protein [Flavobacteriaceae bacterium Ap0902]|nr:WYL domain-containing protein [Flavobacteriaceae bacterium Ap0902]